MNQPERPLIVTILLVILIATVAILGAYAGVHWYNRTSGNVVIGTGLTIILCIIAALAFEFVAFWLAQDRDPKQRPVLYKRAVELVLMETSRKAEGVLGFFLEYVARVIVIFNARLFRTLLLRMKEQTLEIKKQKESLSLTIVGLLISRKARQNFQAYLLLLIALIAYLSLSRLLNLELRAGVILFISGLFLALFINQKVLEYRIKKGFYGTNEFEAREILDFILSHADKSNFSDGQGLKEIMPTPKPVEIYEEEIIDGSRGAEA